jgi:hypothetical protein
LRDDAAVPLICPTCQNVFAGSLKASMKAITGYFAWGCFRYFSWERQPRRPCAVFPDDDRTVANGKSGAAARLRPEAAAPVRLRFRFAQAAPNVSRWTRKKFTSWDRKSVLLRTLVAASGAKTAGSAVPSFRNGAPEEIRTPDPQIRSSKISLRCTFQVYAAVRR